MRILITGGHLGPAIAFIDEILNSSLKTKIEFIFVGRKYNLDDDKTLSLEYQEIKKRKIRFYHLTTGRLTRSLTKKTFFQLLKIPQGFLGVENILKETSPDLIFSFGGYLGLPIVIQGFFKKIPIYIHEQTIAPGLTNKIAGVLANKIFVSFPETKDCFDKKKVIISGNLIRPQIFKIIKTPFSIKKTLPVIYVTGGSLGSHSLNLHLERVINFLLEDFIVVHQTGGVKEYNDFERLNKLRKNLPKAKQERYYIRKFFLSDEIGYIYSLADLVIGRAGANTFFELLALEKPAIFVPLPWSANQEQEKQAKIFLENKAGEIFNQKEESKKLLFLIKKIFSQINFYQENVKKLKTKYCFNGTKIILKEIFS
ncbi:MAG: glycosyltransferase [Patescibacteria group bacterium]|nr:glycosyltransferase [Patescibacteria group bacterium]